MWHHPEMEHDGANDQTLEAVKDDWYGKLSGGQRSKASLSMSGTEL